MKNVAIVVTNLAGSGAEKVALAQAEMFHEIGHNVVLFLLENILTYETGDFPFPIISLTEKKDRFKFLGRLGDKIYAKLLQKEMSKFGKFDAIISNLPRADRVVKQLSHPNKFFVIHMSYKAEIDRFSTKRAIKKLKLYRYLYNNEKIITVSKAIINDFKELNIKYKNATTIYNPFDFEYIRKKGEEKIDIDYKYIISPSAFRVQKRYDVMLDAFRLIEKDIKLLILAKKDPKLEDMIKKRGLQNRVKILGFKQNPYKYIKNAKLLVLSSDREGLPTVIIESLILGTPVVSTDCPSGPSEILVDNLSKWLTKVGDPEDLAKKINKALEEKIEIKDNIIDRFRKEIICEEYINTCLK